MSNLLDDIWEWSIAVLTYWQAYATAGLVAIILAGLEHFVGISIPQKVYLAGAFVFLIVACFMVWSDENHKLEKANQQLDTKEKYREVIVRLQSFISEGTNIQNRCIGADEYLPPLKAGDTADNAYEEWHGRLAKYISENEYLQIYLPQLEDVLQSARKFSPPSGLSNHNAHAWVYVTAYKEKIDEFVKILLPHTL